MKLNSFFSLIFCIGLVYNLHGQIVPARFGASHPSTLSVPDPPTIGTVSIFGLTATVPFTAPINNGASTITSYTVTSNPGGITGSLSQSGGGSITISGLTSGTSYTFSVTATNSIGTSVASSASNSVTANALTLRNLSFEFSGNDLPQTYYGTTWSSDGAWNSIRSYNGTVRTGTYSWLVSFSRSSVDLINSADFNAKSIWAKASSGYGSGSVSQITIRGYNSSNVLVGTVTANVSSFTYSQVTINLDCVRKLVISPNVSCSGCDVYFDDLSFEQ